MHSCIVKAVFISRIIMTILVSNCIFDNLLFWGTTVIKVLSESEGPKA